MHTTNTPRPLGVPAPGAVPAGTPDPNAYWCPAARRHNAALAARRALHALGARWRPTYAGHATLGAHGAPYPAPRP